MRETATTQAEPAEPRPLPVVEIVVPVYNEQRALPECIDRLHGYLTGRFPFPFRIVIADNASTDGTLAVACALAEAYRGVHVMHLDRKGRGLALKAAWGASTADIVAYMDVDLSTDLDALLPLVAPLASGHSELAIGSRPGLGSAVTRGRKREIISRCYNLLLRLFLRAGFSDAQCGFKAGRREVVHRLIEYVEDDKWFFDTELLLLAEKSGMRIHEVPVDWIDDPDSRVDVVRTAIDDLKGMARVGRRIVSGAFGVRMPEYVRQARLPREMPGQLLRFAAIGTLSTLAHLVLYVLGGLVLPALAANAVALAVTAVGNTAANRRFTFGRRDREGRFRSQAEGGLVLTLGRCAERTSTIGLGPGVMIPSLRHPMTAASAIATLAELAGPGRVSVAVGSGFTGRFTLGRKPVPWADVAAYVSVVRGLLRGETAEWEGARIRMLHPDGFGAPRLVDVPFLIGAAGPKGLAVAEGVGGGLFLAGGRPVAGFDQVVNLTFGTVLDDGEDVAAERVMAAAGHAVPVAFHFAVEHGLPLDGFPGAERWRAAYEDVPAGERHLALHDLHLAAVNERDRPFVTPELITAFGLALSPQGWRERLAALEESGITEIAYQPAGPDIPRELEAFAAVAA
ncbi:MAG: LLM class flavin-dependent oxidoreductase [Streptosporangiales bacterium]|nr:LLM class flavin-dependent oxidoreductase [Streptosporangiales bacterium]